VTIRYWPTADLIPLLSYLTSEILRDGGEILCHSIDCPSAYIILDDNMPAHAFFNCFIYSFASADDLHYFKIITSEEY